jgi:hypothetical protein
MASIAPVCERHALERLAFRPKRLKMQNLEMQPNGSSSLRTTVKSSDLGDSVPSRFMYNALESVSPGPEMVKLEHSRAHASLWSRCRIVVVVLAICCLTVSVATRYTVLSPEVQSEVRNVTTVKPLSLDARRQHLLSNALQWTAPASNFTLFHPPRSSVLTVSAVVPSTNLSSESWLYNRPPPSSC